jgi:hypothetical protein
LRLCFVAKAARSWLLGGDAAADGKARRACRDGSTSGRPWGFFGSGRGCGQPRQRFNFVTAEFGSSYGASSDFEPQRFRGPDNIAKLIACSPLRHHGQSGGKNLR